MVFRTIGIRLTFAFGVVIALITLVGVYGGLFAERVADEVEDAVKVAQERTDRISSLRESARDIHLAYASLAAAAFTDDVSRARTLEGQFNETLASLEKDLEPEARKLLASDIAVVTKIGRAWVTRSVEAKRDGSSQLGGDGSPAELALRFAAATGALEKRLDTAVEAERAATNQRLDSLTRTLRYGAEFFAIGVLICFAAAGGFAWWLRRSVAIPITSLTNVAHRIATEGDLTQPIDTSRQDEFGKLANALAELVRALREIPVGLRASVDTLQVAVDDMERVFVDQQGTFSRQAAAIHQTHVTLQEIKQTSQLAAEKANAVVSRSERAAEVSRAGEQALSRSVEGLAMIQTGFDAISANIAVLEDKTSQISGITATVKDIADQSSMLALNAAIEAVRSGEHGRGFSVVAREIRNLADQSINSTRQVGEVLGDIGHAINRAVTITETGEKKIDAGVEQVKQSSQYMGELATIVRESSATARQIAAAVGQQNEGIAQLFMAVTDVSNMMETARKRVEATAEARDKMKEASERVAKIISNFRV